MPHVPRLSSRSANMQTRRPPGPKGLPVIGNVLEAWRDPLGLLMRSARDYGDHVRFRFGPYEAIWTSDLSSIKHVLVDNHRSYTKSRNYAGLKLIVGEGLLTSEGEHWRRQRK